MTLDEMDALCRSFSGCDVRFPFDSAPNLRAWCIGKRMFAWSVTTKTPLTVQVKASPDLVPMLIRNYDCIDPGYHMNKTQWISVSVHACEAQMLRGLLEDAHDLLVDGLPKAQRLSLSGDNGRA